MTMDNELTAVPLDEHGAFFGVFDGHRGGGGGNVRDVILPKKMKKKKCDTKRPSVSKSGGPLCCG